MTTQAVLQDRAALVTGGGTGIGRGVALALARAGAKVAVCGRRREPLDATVAEIAQFGGKAVALTGDIAQAEDCARIVLECAMHLQRLDILVNNAGIARFGPLEETSDEDIAAMIAINLTGAILMSKYAIPELAKHKDSRTASLVNIGTSAAVQPVKNFSVYSATKAGLAHFTRCLALDLADQRIRVNCIQPGVVETPIFETLMPAEAIPRTMQSFAAQTPLGRVGAPADIADAVLYLCSPQADWITGAILTVDGGISLT